MPAAQPATFEFSIRQADDSWQSVPSLTALVATGEGGLHCDSRRWTLRRRNSTNFTHNVTYRDTLD